MNTENNNGIKNDEHVRNVIVVLNYNDSTTCIKFIEETEKYEVFDRVILVDNHSTDDSVQRLKPYTDDRIILIEAGENKGYAYGNNVGMRYAVDQFPRLKSIIISNPDIHISEKDVKKILAKIDEGYGMTTGLIYNYNPETREKYLASNFGWRIPTYRDMLSNCFLIAYKIKRSILHSSMYLEWDRVRGQDVIATEAVPGCFFALDAEAAKKIDYMDEDTFLFGEETILGWRLKNAGFRSCIVNDTAVLHENSVSIKKNINNAKHKARMRLASEQVYLEKYLQCGDAFRKMYTALFWIGQKEKMVINRYIEYRKG